MQASVRSPRNLLKMVQHYKESQLLFAGIKLDIFSYLRDFHPVKYIAFQTGFNERNLSFFLNSLAAIGLLEKYEQTFRNTPEAESFLNRSSTCYIGEYLVFRNEMTSLDKVEDYVRLGPTQAKENEQTARVYDFQKLARLSAVEKQTGRVQSFLHGLSQFYAITAPMKFLDLGAGSGMMSIELANHFPKASGILFEQPWVAAVPEQFVHEHQLQQRLSIWRGDFTTDSIGDEYDLIIASGILDFAGANLDGMTAKLAKSLSPGGYLYLVTHKVNDDYLSPKESIVGWLSSHLTGLDILLTKTAIEASLAKAGFTKTATSALDGAMESLIGEFYTIATQAHNETIRI